MRPKRENEFHKEVQKRCMRFWLLTALVTSFSLVIGGFCIYILFSSRIFTIHTIRIKGNAYVSTPVINNKLHYLIGENIFLAHIDESVLTRAFPLIRTVDVTREYPATLLVTIHEYPPFFLLQTAQITSVLSANGLVIDAIPNASTKYSLPLVVSQYTDISTLPLKQIALFVGTIEEDKKDFITNFSFSPPSELTAHYSDGHSVLFSLNKDVHDQVSEMYHVRDLVGFSKCINLDVRFDNIYCSS